MESFLSNTVDFLLLGLTSSRFLPSSSELVSSKSESSQRESSSSTYSILNGMNSSLGRRKVRPCMMVRTRFILVPFFFIV